MAIKTALLTQDGFWWGMVDSNHRRHCQQIYSLSPLATREIPQIYGYSIGAGGRIRTPDLLITNQLLYQLSYTSISISVAYCSRCFWICQHKSSERPIFLRRKRRVIAHEACRDVTVV